MHPARPSQWSRELERFFLRSLAKRISQTWLNCKCNLAWLLHVRDLGLESSCHMTSVPDCFLQGEGVALSVLSIDLNWAKFCCRNYVCKYWLIFNCSRLMKSLGTVYRCRMTLDLVLHWCILLCCCTIKGECARCLFLKPPRIVWSMIYDVQNLIL